MADGHQGSRVAKFSRDGRFIKSWGTKGEGPGQFNTPHAIATDSKGRLFVADRGNRRIQIFDQEGTFLDEWKQFGRPSGILITADDTIYVADVQDKQGIVYGSAKDGTVQRHDQRHAAREHGHRRRRRALRRRDDHRPRAAQVRQAVADRSGDSRLD